MSRNPAQALTLDGVRDALIRQEDTIVFCLIERARYPGNSRAYDPSFFGHGTSLAEFFVRQSEETDAKVGSLLPFLSPRFFLIGRNWVVREGIWGDCLIR